MRSWQAPEAADILVSELLGSFGDNELSPECLDGAQRFLAPDGISIPTSYTRLTRFRDLSPLCGSFLGLLLQRMLEVRVNNVTPSS
jgi:hypothetical protein